MAREKRNLKGSKKLKKDLNDQEEKRDLNDTQENLNEDLKDIEEDNELKNPKKDLNDLGEEEDDSEEDHNDSEEDSEEDDGLDETMEKNGMGFQQKKTKKTRPVTSIHQGQVPWIYVKGLQVNRDKKIMVGKRSFNYGAIEKASPLEVRDQTLDVFNQIETAYGFFSVFRLFSGNLILSQ